MALPSPAVSRTAGANGSLFRGPAVRTPTHRWLSAVLDRVPVSQRTPRLRSLINPPFFSPLPVSRAPLGLEGRHLLVPPTEVHLIDYMQIAVHVHATIKLLLVPVGVTDTECIRIVPELTSTQNGRAEPAAAQWKPSQQELAAGHTSPPSWPSSLCVGRAYPRLCCCRVSAPLCTVVGYCNLT